ncbi:MAG: 30S ribosomal protein S12 methylthiotransferase RimO [Clostridia bacterium]|nr:30S ribosomal protein S12 methylthiotransferase RimO [Clostridia bacterium]
MKIGFVSLGCPKNLVDTEVMLGILGNNGYELVSNPEDADVIVVNTCGFIDAAKTESIETILEMAQYKNNKCKLLIASGCLAERYHDDILEELPEVDAVVGTGDYIKIAEVIKSALKGEKPVLYGNMNMPEPEGQPRVVSTGNSSAYLKIADGCDNRCTYCIIPKLRGKYRSRHIEDIVSEAESLAKDGIRELIVIAQDTTRYGMDLYGEYLLPELLQKLCKIEGIHWIRVHYLYPEVITDELISVFKNEDKIVKYMDIPIQHCNDEVLKRMGRHGNKEQLYSLINKLRKEIPGLVIRTTVIAGFPGETEEQFGELLQFVKDMKFERLGAFAYSQEEDTPAAKLPEQIKQDVKDDRAAQILEIQSEISKNHQHSLLGKQLEVLVEGYDMDNLMYFGRSYADSIDIDTTVYFAAEDEVISGSFVTVEILDADDYDLTGKLVLNESEESN